MMLLAARGTAAHAGIGVVIVRAAGCRSSDERALHRQQQQQQPTLLIARSIGLSR